jgi:RNA polymerase II-associated factor 1
LLTETDLGLPIDLIDPDIYKEDRTKDSLSGDPQHETDAHLMEDEITPQPEKKRSRQHAKNVSWLRKTEYISTEYNRFQTSSENLETKVGYNVKKLFQEKDVYKDRDSQIEAIEGTFKAAKKPILKHHSKPGVTAKEILPLFPDFDMWKFPFAQVIFDTDPAAMDKSGKEQLDEMSHAMIRGMVDDEGEQFVGYFLPTVETKRKRKRDADEGLEYTPGEEYEYKMAREYNWTVKNKLSKGYEENYFFVLRDGEGVFYDELETR